jgi:hypothetical protein
MSDQTASANAAPPASVPPNLAPARTAKGGAAVSFEELLASGTREEKQRALFLLLRDLLGPRAERELGVFDPEGFLFACIMPPGRREALRLLEDPERARRLDDSSQETIPLREVLQQLGAMK